MHRRHPRPTAGHQSQEGQETSLTVQELQQKKKKRGRPRLSDALVQFRLPYKDGDFLTAVSKYLERDKAEILRTLFLGLKKEYQRSPTFRRWVKRHAAELQAIDIDPEDLF